MAVGGSCRAVGCFARPEDLEELLGGIVAHEVLVPAESVFSAI